jgi:hypothetical protein
MARRQMGEVRVLPKRDTGVQVVDALAGAEPVETARPKRKRPPAPKPQPARQERLEAVLYRVTAEQRRALNAKAFRRAEERGSGKPDASEVLREVLQAWLEAD